MLITWPVHGFVYNGIFSGMIAAIVVSVVSALVVLAVGIVIGTRIWKQRSIERKRRGKKLIFYAILHIQNQIHSGRLLLRASLPFDQNMLDCWSYGFLILQIHVTHKTSYSS